MGLLLLFAISWLAALTATVFDLGISGPVGSHGEPTFETAFSWRDLILIAGGVFLVWKATTEIQHKVQPAPADSVFSAKVITNLSAAIFQIVILDMVFSIDSVLTAIGMTDQLPIMVTAIAL